MNPWDNYKCNDRHCSPVIARAVDGILTLRWPDEGAETCAVAKHVLVDMVGTMNILVVDNARLTRIAHAAGYMELQAERDDLQAEVERLRDHSRMLNAVAWRISELLGEVGPEDTEHWSDQDVLTRLNEYASRNERGGQMEPAWGFDERDA